MSEAVKRWRLNRTTIIITHDLSPIETQDFVYVMAEGRVVEQGYRADLKNAFGGAFYSLAHTQRAAPSFDAGSDDDDEDLGSNRFEPHSVHSTPRIAITPAFDEGLNAAASLGFFGSPSSVDLARASRELVSARRASATFVERQEALALANSPPRTPPRQLPSRDASPNRRLSTTPPPPVYNYSNSPSKSRRDSSMSFTALELAGQSASARRPGGLRIKHKTLLDDELQKEWPATMKDGVDTVAVDMSPEEPPRAVMSLGQLSRRYYPTIPNKWLLFGGLGFCMVVGFSTPVFAFLLSKLLSNLGTPGSQSLTTTMSLLILLVAFIDGSATFLKFYLLERCAMGWVTQLRRQGFGLVVKQGKAWLDRSENSTSSLTHSLVKDTEDGRLVIGTLIGQLAVVASMLGLGLIWAFTAGWELTLVGLGLAPVFIVITRIQAGVLNKYEAKNKNLREEVSKRFHTVRVSLPRALFRALC